MKRNFPTNLCNWCLKRQNIKIYRFKNLVDDCEICHGIENQIPKITLKIIQATRDYEYETFLIGLRLDHSFYDNEDKFRSRFKIRGKENIKTNLLHDIRKNLGKITNKKNELNSPDITVNLELGKKFEMAVSVNSSTVVLSGRYWKPRRFQFLSKNSNNDNSLKNNHRYIGNVLKKKLTDLFGTESITFWPLGKEEPISLVLGGGRPFYATIKNSKIISFKHGYSIRANGLIFNLAEKLPTLPVAVPFYVKKVRALVSFEENLRTFDLKSINDSGIRIIEFIGKRKKNWKFIYQIQSRLKSRKKLELIIFCDNLFPIRKFIDGDKNITPNLRHILGRKCKCDFFDILDIVSEDDLLN